MKQSIFVSRVVGSYFSFISNYHRMFCQQTEETLIRRHVLWRLIWVRTVYLCPRFIWVNMICAISFSEKLESIFCTTFINIYMITDQIDYIMCLFDYSCWNRWVAGSSLTVSIVLCPFEKHFIRWLFWSNRGNDPIWLKNCWLLDVNHKLKYFCQSENADTCLKIWAYLKIKFLMPQPKHTLWTEQNRT